jgi:hypothetical protein
MWVFRRNQLHSMMKYETIFGTSVASRDGRTSQQPYSLPLSLSEPNSCLVDLQLSPEYISTNYYADYSCTHITASCRRSTFGRGFVTSNLLILYRSQVSAHELQARASSTSTESSHSQNTTSTQTTTSGSNSIGASATTSKPSVTVLGTQTGNVTCVVFSSSQGYIDSNCCLCVYRNISEPTNAATVHYAPIQLVLGAAVPLAAALL